MCYVNSTLDLKMIGWVGDDISCLDVSLHADADFAGCDTHASRLQEEANVRDALVIPPLGLR